MPPNEERMQVVAALAFLLAAQAAAENQEPGDTFSDELPDGGRGPDMVVIPAGSFQMGCALELDCFDDQKPVHRVTISQALAISTLEITFEDYGRFADPSDLDDQGWGAARTREQGRGRATARDDRPSPHEPAQGPLRTDRDQSCSPHNLCRMFVSELLKAGANFTSVQRLVGHQSPTTTARYDRRG